MVAFLTTAQLRYVAATAGITVGAIGVGALAVKFLLEKMHSSVGIAPPTEEQKKQEDQNEHALF